MQVVDESIPWGEQQVEQQAKDAARLAMAKVEKAAKEAKEAAVAAGKTPLEAEVAAQTAADAVAAEAAERARQAEARWVAGKARIEVRPQYLAEGRAEGRQEVLPVLRRSLAGWTRDRFGEAISHSLSSEIELLEDPAAFDRICGWVETCESGASLLALVHVVCRATERRGW